MTQAFLFERRWLGAAVAAIALQQAPPALASPIEHAVDTAGQLGAVALRYGDHTLNAGLVTVLEVDRFTVQAAAGDSFEFRLRTATGAMNPLVQLRGPNGAVLKSTNCNGFGAPCSALMDFQAVSAGVYTFNVSDNGGDAVGAYQVHLEQLPPVGNWLGMRYDTLQLGSLEHSTDIDVFGFRVQAGTGVRLAVRSVTGAINPLIDVWSPGQGRISETHCNGFGAPCTNVVDFSPTASGVYLVGVSDNGFDQVGNYSLEVSCTFGSNCPTRLDLAPVPIPEPASGLLMLAGAGLLGWLRYRRQGVACQIQAGV